jgi:hypothetical protein
MPKISHARRLKEALNKFEPKEAEKALDLLAADEERGRHEATKEEESLRERLIKCLEVYERTMYLIER